MSIANIKGTAIGYDDLGNGNALVFVHGHPFNRSMWSPQASLFSATHRVIAPDLRGYGESPITAGKVSLEEHAQDIHALLDHLGVEQIVLGGLSMGGQIVLEFYRQFPERVRALMLADTFAQLDTPQVRENRIKTSERILREGLRDYAIEVLPKMITPANIESRPAVAAHVLEMMQHTSPEGAAASLRGRIERRDYVPLLPTIAVPTLIVVGREDEFTPVSDAELMHSLIPHATLDVIEGAGHMPNLERPSEFNAVLAHWLACIH